LVFDRVYIASLMRADSCKNEAISVIKIFLLRLGRRNCTVAKGKSCWPTHRQAVRTHEGRDGRTRHDW